MSLWIGATGRLLNFFWPGFTASSRQSVISFELFFGLRRPVYQTGRVSMVPDRQILRCELLVIQYQRGDRSAFESIIQMWERPLFCYLRRLAPSEADTWDLLQETWLKVSRSLGKLRDARTLPAFLYKTARNTAISRLRNRAFEEYGASPSDEYFENSVDEIAKFDDAEQIHHALDQLPLPQREALTLYFLQDLSLEEVATVLGVPVGTVKSRLHYAKIAIRKILSKGTDHAE
jgi:RNA polymerase sigma-70 factor (ECF subfamily)